MCHTCHVFTLFSGLIGVLSLGGRAGDFAEGLHVCLCVAPRVDSPLFHKRKQLIKWKLHGRDCPSSCPLSPLQTKSNLQTLTGTEVDRVEPRHLTWSSVGTRFQAETHDPWSPPAEREQIFVLGSKEAAASFGAEAVGPRLANLATNADAVSQVSLEK